jgi:hypothetical protein
MDPHTILGVSRQATLEEIHIAYRAKARKHHPDTGGDAWAFKQVVAAYERLVELKTGRPVEPEAAPRTDPPTAPAARPASPAPARGNRVRSPTPRTTPARPAWDVRQLGRLLWQAGFRHLPLQDETSHFILINALDIFVTYLVVATGGIEANPIARVVLRHWGFNGMIGFKMAIVAFVTVVAQVIARRDTVTAGRLLNGSTLVVSIVVVYGLVLLAKPT